jgi:RNA polymerase-binding protein DksA
VAKQQQKKKGAAAPSSKKTPAARLVAKKSSPPAKGSKPAKAAPAAAARTKSIARPAAAPAPVARKVAPARSGAPGRSFAMPQRAGAPMPVPPMAPPPSPVPTNGKPRKNQAGLSSKELEHFRDLLLQKRREIVGDMSQMEREALRSASGSNLSNLPLHMADMGTDNYEQEFTLGLVEKDRVILREINSALAKIMDGSYGVCEGTAKPISKVRLEAQPWARFSIEYARQMEKGFIR